MIAALLACCLLQGHVLAASGTPLADARVVLTGPAQRTARTDAGGSFHVEVPPGRYEMQASAQGYVATTATIAVDRPERIDVSLQPVDSAQLRVIGSVRVDGRLALSHDAIPTVNVSRADLAALGADRVIDGLAEVPSVTFARPDGGASTAPSLVALRGPDPSETLVALDGQILNDGNTGDLDLSRFPVAAFSNVAVSEGLGPLDSEGSNTIGGAIDIVSLQPTRSPHGAFSASTGSFDRNELWYNATGTHAKLGYAFALDDQQEGGYVNQAVIRCAAGYDPSQPQPCASPAPTHLGSAIRSRAALANLSWNISQRADLGMRLFVLADARDESGVLDTPVDLRAQGPGDFFTGPGAATFAQVIRAYDLHGRAPLGAGSLVADASLSDNGVTFAGTGVSPYDLTHRDLRQTFALSWQRTLARASYAIGGYLRNEALNADGVQGTPSQHLQSYFLRGAIHPAHRLRIEAGLFASHYSTFGSNLDGRISGSYDLTPQSTVRFSAGTGFRAPLLIERYVFPTSQLALDQNCVAIGQGNPNEQPEHATEYELGYGHTFSNVANLDVSLYRTNLRDPIETFYPLNASCPAQNPPLESYPINVGNVVYEGAEVRFTRRFAHVLLTARYGLNVAYPYDLPATVTNPTSGGNLVAYQQFLNIPQQQGSLGIDWHAGPWHAALDAIVRGKNNELNQGPYALLDGGIGRTFHRVDVTLAATNITNAVAGRFTLPGLGARAYGTSPTDLFFVEPFGLRLIVTLRS